MKFLLIFLERVRAGNSFIHVIRCTLSIYIITSLKWKKARTFSVSISQVIIRLQFVYPRNSLYSKSIII
jgi:hypothetical protein